MPILLKLFQKKCRGRNISRLTLWCHHHHDTKTRQKQHKIWKLQSNITDEHTWKKSKILGNRISNVSKNICNDQVECIPGMQDFYSISKSINVIYHINKLKDKNQMIISIDAEKPLKKFTHLWLKLQKMCIEGTYLNIVKTIYDKPTVNINLNGGNWKYAP